MRRQEQHTSSESPIAPVTPASFRRELELRFAVDSARGEQSGGINRACDAHQELVSASGVTKESVRYQPRRVGRFVVDR